MGDLVGQRNRQRTIKTLKLDDRRAIVEILRETKSGLAGLLYGSANTLSVSVATTATYCLPLRP